MQVRELRQYRYFLTLAQELHFGRAAELSCITQPALSQQIARLEETMGVQLLLREHRKVTLTRAGEVLRDRTRQLFQQMEDTARLTREAASLDDFRLAIGLVEYTSVALLPAALARLHPWYPEMKVVRHEMPAPAQISALQQGQIDIGFGGLHHGPADLLPADGSISAQQLLQSGWRILLRDSHPLAALERISLKQLCGERVIMQARELNASLYDWIQLAFHRSGACPHFVYETCQVQTGLQLAQNGLGCLLLADFVHCGETPGLRAIPLDGLEQVTMHLFWRSSESRPLVLDFLHLVLEEAGASTGNHGAT